jgi:hypothetical protein
MLGREMRVNGHASATSEIKNVKGKAQWKNFAPDKKHFLEHLQL